MGNDLDKIIARTIDNTFTYTNIRAAGKRGIKERLLSEEEVTVSRYRSPTGYRVEVRNSLWGFRILKYYSRLVDVRGYLHSRYRELTAAKAVRG